jgi:hypothetical protein
METISVLVWTAALCACVLIIILASCPPENKP